MGISPAKTPNTYSFSSISSILSFCNLLTLTLMFSSVLSSISLMFFEYRFNMKYGIMIIKKVNIIIFFIVPPKIWLLL